MSRSGPQLALLSAVLFGISPALIKALLGSVSPLLVAGMLYLGSGLGLLVLLSFERTGFGAQLKTLSTRQRLKLLGAIVSGGLAAPVLLTYGIRRGTAFEVSLLLNLETVATTLIAAFVFHEHVGRRVWAGKALIVAGAILVSLNLSGGMAFSVSSLLVVGACALWGIDNNLTRELEELSPTLLSSVKGLAAGIFNTALALLLTRSAPTLPQAGAMLAIGALSYGLSLVLFVKALRLIGSARTSTYFAVGPFVGMAASVLVLGDALTRPPARHPPPAPALARR
ncbi:MAG: DMT family transporter [Deltaproteobacteria bacterium]|nr:DMT family transporter [Deltaproteobacteria bacterium]